MFYLIHNDELKLQFDVTGVEDALPSIAFDIIGSWNMPYQQVDFSLKECWFECSTWDKFQNNILLSIEQNSGCISLNDVSENPIITLTKEGNELTTVIQCKDSCELGLFKLRVSGYSIELPEIYNKMLQLDKWW